MGPTPGESADNIKSVDPATRENYEFRLYKFFRWAFFSKNSSDELNLRQVERDVLERLDVLDETIKKIKTTRDLNLEDHEIFYLASTDIFVEKAQQVLTDRASSMRRNGYASIAFSGILIFSAISIIAYRMLTSNIPQIDSTFQLIYLIFQAVALSAFVLVGVKLFVPLARSFFHESISLLERRHALRFGRLYVYLKRGVIGENRLEETFQWNKETRTSFLDMKPEIVAETLLHKIVDTLRDMPPEVAQAIVSRTKKETKGIFGRS